MTLASVTLPNIGRIIGGQLAPAKPADIQVGPELAHRLGECGEFYVRIGLNLSVPAGANGGILWSSCRRRSIVRDCDEPYPPEVGDPKLQHDVWEYADDATQVGAGKSAPRGALPWQTRGWVSWEWPAQPNTRGGRSLECEYCYVEGVTLRDIVKKFKLTVNSPWSAERYPTREDDRTSCSKIRAMKGAKGGKSVKISFIVNWDCCKPRNRTELEVRWGGETKIHYEWVKKVEGTVVERDLKKE
ncbi:hypothetical protein PLCT2_00813 [Planctomycetaceae bacterium]|nr:hypothetical protein PLCT2_00813 [Planctomycetaceae bacterium]